MRHHRHEPLRIGLGLLLAFGAMNAFGGGLYGMSGAAGVPREWLYGTPFSNYGVPSLILFSVVGAVFLAAAMAVFLCWEHARQAAYAAAVVVLGWIAAQLLIIGYVSWLQPAVVAAAAIIVLLAAQLPASLARPWRHGASGAHSGLFLVLAAGLAMSAPARAERNMSLTVGGGLNVFAGEEMGSVADPGASWDFRFVIGTRSTVGVEFGYVGTVREKLRSTGLEAALRLHIADGPVQPYFLAGGGWMRYQHPAGEMEVMGETPQDVLEVPLGIGMAFRHETIVVDGRAAYHASERSKLDNYDLSLRLGVEF